MSIIMYFIGVLFSFTLVIALIAPAIGTETYHKQEWQWEDFWKDGIWIIILILSFFSWLTIPVIILVRIIIAIFEYFEDH